MNHFIGIGRLTKDPIERMTNSGRAVTSFTLAINRRGTDATDFINCVAWNKLAGLVAQYTKKGSQVMVAGQLQTRSYEVDGQKRNTFEIIASEVEFLGSKQADSNYTAEQPKTAENEAEDDFTWF